MELDSIRQALRGVFLLRDGLLGRSTVSLVPANDCSMTYAGMLRVVSAVVVLLICAGGSGAFMQSGGAKQAPGGTQRAQPADADRGWVIALAAFRGEKQVEEANAELARLRTVGLAADAYVLTRGRATLVAIGRFDDPASKAAQDELSRVRAVKVGEVLPFASAVMAPPMGDGGVAGTRPDYDLRTAAKEADGRERYTLQVAAYGAANPLAAPTQAELSEARKAAEQAAAILRAEGEQAYYYHGPQLSMVTVGIFGDEAVRSPEPASLSLLKSKFPNNLYNGSGMRSRIRGQSEKELSRSFLVKVPEAPGAEKRRGEKQGSVK